ncbi:MAG: hypothetical protein H7Y18_10795 [Clostridiaceae bacterium]|nr:hypothetical protein [Clostridiaceae bacterium]
MEHYTKIKNKETYERYYEKLVDWHLNVLDQCDLSKIKKLSTSCKNTIMGTKESDYKYLLDSIKNGDIKRTELELFLFKLDYYLYKIRCLKLELGCHIVSFNDGYKDLKTLRADFSHIYKYITRKKEIKGLYKLIHKKYKYILNGSTSDFMNIKAMKQAKYIKVYIELLWVSEEVNKLWQLNVNTLKLKQEVFSQENSLVKLEDISERLHKITNLFILYKKSIVRLLKRNTCYKELNPYDECTYDKINDVVDYIYYYDEYITQKHFFENQNNMNNLYSISNS